jgi:hypothetical protein
VLNTAVEKCNQIGTVYRMSGRRGLPTRVEEVQFEFPINKSIIENCAEAALEISRRK